MTQDTETEPTEPTVKDVPEPDQDPHEPVPDEAEEEAEADETSVPFEPPEETEPAEASGLTQRDWEKRFEKAEKAFEVYARRIGVIFEDDAVQLIPFPLGQAAPLGFIHRDEAGRVPDEIKSAVLQYIGLPREQDYADDPETHTCDRCQGKGKTKTGSLVAEYATQTCPTCKGRGAVGLAYAGAPSETNGHVDEPFTLAQETNKETADADDWGQPRLLPDGRDNPNYGRMPSYWVEVEPWGKTQNLNALSRTE